MNLCEESRQVIEAKRKSDMVAYVLFAFTVGIACGYAWAMYHFC